MKITFVFLFLTVFSFGQETQKSAFVEAFGPGGFWSLNYQIEQKVEKGSLEVRLGISSYNVMNPLGKFNPDVSFPVGFYYRPAQLQRFKVGGGVTFNSIQEFQDGKLKRSSYVGAYAGVGFRFLQKEHWWAELNAYYINTSFIFNSPWGGCSLGYRF